MASKSIVTIMPLDMCRICLTERPQKFIDILAPNEPDRAQFVKDYYKVEVTGNDGRSTKLCQHCMEHIEVWRGRIDQARSCQMVVNYLAEKKLMFSTSDSQNQERSLFESNKKNNIEAKKSKKRKRFSSEHEEQLASTSAILQIPPRESIQYPPSCPPSISISTEIISFLPSSTSIIPYMSDSTEIVAMIDNSSNSTTNIPSSGVDPIQYSLVNDKKNHVSPSETFTRSKSLKAECTCLFCTYQYEDVSLNTFKNILFCSHHAIPYACLVENCFKIFPSEEVFIEHYLSHMKLDKSTSLCRLCFGIFTSKNTHTHQSLMKCCSLDFASMHKFGLHKIINHNAVIITNDHQQPLKKLIMPSNKFKTEVIDIKDSGLDVPKKTRRNGVGLKVKEENRGSLKCPRCSHYFSTLSQYTKHIQIKHNDIISLRESGIKLCPLCDLCYFFDQFVSHIESCTNTLKVGDNKLNHYGCFNCKFVFTNLSSRQIRNHVIYCKSFRLVVVNNKLSQKCKNCTFISVDDNVCLAHANNDCLYLQLKMRYAMKPEEKLEALQRMQFYEANTQQPDCTDVEGGSTMIPSTSKIVCNTARQSLLKSYNFLCNVCNKFFFAKDVFLKHLNSQGVHCRSPTLVYCQKCVTDFETEEEYQDHVPKVIVKNASPITSVKQEVLDDNHDEDVILCDVITRGDINDYYDVKVFEMNNSRQASNVDVINNMQYQEQDNSFASQEMEFNDNDEYMQCDIEDKSGLNQLLVENIIL